MKLIFKSLGTLPLRRFLSTVPQLLNPVPEATLEECCILVNQHDQKCGFDELLLQQLSSTKITFPDHYTNSCCSHPLYEIQHDRKDLEGAKAAACRRLVFELVIPASQCQPKDLQYITRIKYMSEVDQTWDEHKIDYTFILHKDVSLDPNPDENLNHPIIPCFNLIAQNKLTNWWDNDNRLCDGEKTCCHILLACAVSPSSHRKAHATLRNEPSSLQNG